MHGDNDHGADGYDKVRCQPVGLQEHPKAPCRLLWYLPHPHHPHHPHLDHLHPQLNRYGRAT